MVPHKFETQKCDDPEAVKHVWTQMEKWDGNALHPFPEYQGTFHPLVLQWMRDVHQWNRRVRRDILVIEHHLQSAKCGIPKSAFFGDPGDPPPPPDEL